MTTEFEELFAKLKQYGVARNRMVDKEPRTITITDDEALILLVKLRENQNGSPSDGSHESPNSL